VPFTATDREMIVAMYKRRESKEQIAATVGRCPGTISATVFHMRQPGGPLAGMNNKTVVR
jgi:IS30 family transposase